MLAAKAASFAALCFVLVPCVLLFCGLISLEGVKWNALLGTIGWFVTTPLWMGRGLGPDADQVQV